jgi:sister-chromatid-cohesion protein PDS5
MLFISVVTFEVTNSLITQTISKDLQNVDDQKLVAHITVLAELAHKVPDAFESKSEEIMNFIVKQILMTPSLRDPVRVLSACLFL